MACTLSNMCAKNVSKRTVLLQSSKTWSHVFFGTQCIHILVLLQQYLNLYFCRECDYWWICRLSSTSSTVCHVHGFFTHVCASVKLDTELCDA